MSEFGDLINNHRRKEKEKRQERTFSSIEVADDIIEESKKSEALALMGIKKQKNGGKKIQKPCYFSPLAWENLSRAVEEYGYKNHSHFLNALLENLNEDED